MMQPGLVFADRFHHDEVIIGFGHPRFQFFAVFSEHKPFSIPVGQVFGFLRIPLKVE